ncbi:hypothetical protein EI94DRAFT_287989 [Lactarius quietus]|nr:hypothetical protein EI94DRAFT_287989 [Lactarius quietus]
MTSHNRVWPARFCKLMSVPYVSRTWTAYRMLHSAAMFSGGHSQRHLDLRRDRVSTAWYRPPTPRIVEYHCKSLEHPRLRYVCTVEQVRDMEASLGQSCWKRGNDETTRCIHLFGKLNEQTFFQVIEPAELRTRVLAQEARHLRSQTWQGFPRRWRAPDSRLDHPRPGQCRKSRGS